MDQNLLQSGLQLLLIPLTLGIRRLRQVFAMDPNKPTINEGVIQLLMCVCGLGLAYSAWAINHARPTMITDYWFVQGILFYIAMLTFDVGADATSTKTMKAQVAIAQANAPALIAFALAGALLFGASPVLAADAHPTAERFSAGVEFGAQHERSDVNIGQLGVAPAFYGTYNVTEHLTLATSYQRELTHDWGAYRFGGRVRVLEIQRIRLFAGVDYLNWHGDGTSYIVHKNTVDFSLMGSVPVVSETVVDRDTGMPSKRTLVWFVVRADVDPQAGDVYANENGNFTTAIHGLRVALRYQAMGGNP